MAASNDDNQFPLFLYYQADLVFKMIRDPILPFPEDKALRYGFKWVGSWEASHSPAVVRQRKDILADRMGDPIFPQKSRVKTISKVGGLWTIFGVLFMEKAFAGYERTAEPLSYKVRIAGSMVVMAVAAHCKIHLLQPDAKALCIVQGMDAGAKIEENACILCLNIKG